MKYSTNFFLKLVHLNISVKKLLVLLKKEITLQDFSDFSAQDLKYYNFSEQQIDRWKNFDDSSITADLQWLDDDNNQLLTFFDKDYPSLLQEIADPPLALFVKGDASLLCLPQLAIVGSRNPTKVGKDIAFDFARHLASAGIIITSGMATGIDAASHRGALEAKEKTIAVCGTGLDRVYPAVHRDLAQQIAQNGALVSEYPCRTAPKPHHFPQRNRIISGLTLGTLVVEAALKSGSLITARLAAEQGREVFAIPGSVHNPLVRGCHNLIREGAKLVETGDHILEELGALANVTGGEAIIPMLENVKDTPILDGDYHLLLDYIGYETTPVDVIVANSSFSTDVVASMLLILELNSYVKAQPGGYVRIK